MKTIKQLLITIAVLLCSTTMYAYDFEVDGIYYNITSSDNMTVEVTYKDTSSYYNEYSGSIVIPSTVSYSGTVFNVTSIGEYAFSYCSGLTSITIPESVTSIKAYAFNGCTSLKDLRIEDGNTTLELSYNYHSTSKYDGDGKGLFYDCPLETLYLGRNLSYNTSRYDGYSPFYEQDELKSLTISNSVTSISDYVFYYCSGLTSITIPESVTSIESYAFSGCSGLTSITIPESVTYIHGHTFSGCSGLTSITIPESVTSIESYAFSGCSGLTSITIPESVTSIGNSAFSGCSGLTSITIPESVTYIGDYAFSGCRGLTSITIPESVTSIRDYAFSDCSGLTSITIPESVTSIQKHTFSGCSGLTSITIPESVTSIKDYAFSDCSGLTSITIPESVTSIGNFVFINCTSLKDLRIEDGNTTLDLGANASLWACSSLFKDCPLETLYLGRNLTCKILGSYSGSTYALTPFYNQDELKSLTISNNVTYIGGSAFRNCSGLTSITIPESVTSIGNSAFHGCSGLTSITIPESVTSIGSSAFSGCSGLTSITIPESVTSIGGSTFSGCSGLTSITIPESVTSIGSSAFSGCSGLTSITIPESVTSIGGSAFSGCSGLTSISIPKSVKKIGDNVFERCTNLSDIIIEDRNEILSLGSNGSSALFADCPLDSLYIGGKITYETSSYYGYSPFYRNTSLRTVVITNKEDQIYDNEFYGCSNLKNVIIGHGVESIGDYAFSGCSSLDGFSFGSNLKTIGAEAFSDCTNITSITSHAKVPPTCSEQALEDINKWTCVLKVPQNYASAYQAADQWKEFFYIEDVVEIELFTITYIVDGEVYATEKYAAGDEITPEEEPTKEGYTFSGWSEIPETMPAEDVTVTGSFSINSYDLVYMIDGEEYKRVTLEFSSEIIPEDEPEKEGYTFSGWSEIPETMPAEDITITGSFSINSYDLVYLVDDEEYKRITLEFGSEILPEEEPEKEGYTFSGWSDIPETMPAHDVTVTGSFSINSYDLVYMIDGEEYKRVTLEFGSEILPEEEPTKEGYTFSGWSEIPETMPAEDVTVTGSFSINSYDLVYMVDGEEYKRVTLEFGSEIVPEEEPTKEGYTFSGWSEIPETMPAHDVEVTGSFSINSYDLVYMIDGEEYKRMTLEFGSEILPEEEPTKEGYTFSGWSEIPETMPAEDVTVTGTFSINSYDLVYMVDGEEYKRVTLEFGSEIVPEEEPTKEGYTFSGWSEIPETMPAEDVTVTGSFSINSYDLVYMVDGEEYKRVTLEFGSEIVPEEEPTKEDYTFSGWSEIPETMPAHDVEVTGSFIPTNVSEIIAEVSLQINGNNISLSNANNSTIAIYNINGVLVKRIDKYAGEEIALEKGVYIVSVGDKAMKIKL